MIRRSVVFREPRRIEVATDAVPSPGDGEVLVESLVSAISAGTEMHLYRGDLPEGVALDESLPSLKTPLRYPTTYGYASVGRVVGDGRRALAFQPHVSHYVARDEDLFVLPETLDEEQAAFWPTAETAVNLVLDARPLVGERVLVVGQGVVGLMTTSVLSQFPLGALTTVDPIETRREASRQCGAKQSLAPGEAAALGDYDLTIEVSGTSSGLDTAIAATGFEGRVVVGSWYRDAPILIGLGTHFHRGRIRLISSQVSHLGASLASRWSKERRMRVAAAALERAPVGELVSHRFPVERAAEAYALLDEHPDRCLQVLLTYT